MPIVMPIENGQIPTQNTSTEDKKTQAQENKDMFMQLLVAEMQYQDPLEPTDNSQYIQQLYSMSQTESVLAVQEDVEEMTVKNLVGRYVTCHDSKTGESGEGKVDSVAQIDGEWKVSINGKVFPTSSIQQVHDTDYFVSVSAADTLTELVNNLPSLEKLKVGHQADLQKAVDVYNSMSDYAKGFLGEGIEQKLTDLVGRMNALLKATSGSEDAGNSTDKDSNETQATEKTE